MSRLPYFAISERWSSAANNDAFCAEKVGDVYLFGIAEGLSGEPGLGSASGVAIKSLITAAGTPEQHPAAILNAAVHASEARIRQQKSGSPGTPVNATHLSAGIVNSSLEATILDTGEGHALLIGREGIFVPRDHPRASPLREPVFPAPSPGSKKDMIAHTLGEPHVLKNTDFVTVDLQGLSLVLSSGGLHDVVPRDRIAEIVRDHGENVETACQQLVQEAQRAGSERTITVVLVHGHLH
jgi:serine/threonine protein phosphatase PrpC